MLSRCCTAILLKSVFLCTFWRKKILVLWRKIVQNLFIFVYLLILCIYLFPKISTIGFYKNLHNSGMVGRRKLPDPSLNCIFNALPIGVQYTLSFQWTNFRLKCLLCLMFSITWKPVNWLAFQAEVCKKHLGLQTYQQQYSIGSFYIGKICVGTAPVKI